MSAPVTRDAFELRTAWAKGAVSASNLPLRVSGNAFQDVAERCNQR